MKVVYCAQCGKQLQILRKAVPSLHKIFDMVEPHQCEGENEEITAALEAASAAPKKTKKDVQKLFDNFTFVEKLNKGDKRSTEFLRQEKGVEKGKKPIGSGLPEGLERAMKDRLPSSQPAEGREIVEQEEE